MRLPNEVIILANPYSGKGQNKPRVAALSDALLKRGMSARQVWDLDERAELLSKPDVGEQYRCIVSAGGDGSMAGVSTTGQRRRHHPYRNRNAATG